ncbi:hypothetical protein [Actinocorallia longicatena]|uniref:Uncharacterized protein n=1 Tax=Actinocorallia longicatena TaxID=111803 RepID=A0ABP6Q868_9ACTN
MLENVFMGSTRYWPWIVVAGISMTTVGVVLLAFGLDAADKVAGIVGGLGTVTGLVLTVRAFGLQAQRGRERPDSPPVRVQRITGTTVRGHGHQTISGGFSSTEQTVENSDFGGSIEQRAQGDGSGPGDRG